MLKRIQYNSPVILTVTLISLCSLLIGYLTNGISTNLFFSVYRSSLFDVLFYVRLFGHILGHANLNHFISNFLLILILGPMLEEKYGSKKMILMFALTAIITGVLNIIISDKGVLGASGIVFMLILLSSFTNLSKGRIPLTFILVLIIYLGNEIVDGISLKDNISHMSHIIGGVCGSIFGFITHAPNKCESLEE